MTENYLKALVLSCIYLWKQFSAVHPCNQILVAYAKMWVLWIFLPIKRAREEMNTRRMLFSFRVNYLNLLVWVSFDYLKYMWKCVNK